jgi:hypothetical protein
MNAKQLMTVGEFTALTEILPNTYENPFGVEIDGLDGICARIIIWTGKPTSFTLWIELEPEKFISEFCIKDMADIDAITEGDLWAQYQKGNGKVWADLDYLGGKSLCFSVTKDNRTAIKGDQMAYTDEVSGAWDNAEYFKAYVREHMLRIYVAVEVE